MNRAAEPDSFVICSQTGDGSLKSLFESGGVGEDLGLRDKAVLSVKAWPRVTTSSICDYNLSPISPQGQLCLVLVRSLVFA